jgi:hypothetical protein
VEELNEELETLNVEARELEGSIAELLRRFSVRGVESDNPRVCMEGIKQHSMSTVQQYWSQCQNLPARTHAPTSSATENRVCGLLSNLPPSS